MAAPFRRCGQRLCRKPFPSVVPDKYLIGSWRHLQREEHLRLAYDLGKTLLATERA